MTEELKEEIWNHFISKAKRYPPNITKLRLANLKPIIFNDDIFWADMTRHGWGLKTTEEVQGDKFVYEHCEGNFWGMIVQSYYQKKRALSK